MPPARRFGSFVRFASVQLISAESRRIPRRTPSSFPAVATMIRFIKFVALAFVLSATVGCSAKPDPEVERRKQEERAAEHRAAYAEGHAHLAAGSHDAGVAACG